MPRRPRLRSKSGIYHIMLRGANRQEIFHDEVDRMKFLDIIAKYRGEFDLRIYAWCLMDNHVHLLIKEGREDISNTMKRIGVSFVYYYNRKYRTNGHLFQDRFWSKGAETPRYFLEVIRYIHQNPVKAGMVNQVDEWSWSSCSMYYYGRPTYWDGMLDSDFVFRLFSDNLPVAKRRFKEFNEQVNEDECLDDGAEMRRLTDEEAREGIKEILGTIEIAQVKSLPRIERNELLREMKTIKGVSKLQIARILGISPNLVNRE